MTVPYKKFLVATEAVTYVACQPGDIPVRSRDISAYQGVKLRYLEQILQPLVQGGVLKSVRGPKGGYLLAKERRKITLWEIFDAVEGQEAGEPAISALQRVVIEPLQQEMRQLMLESLRQRTIQQCCDSARDARALPGSSLADFTI